MSVISYGSYGNISSILYPYPSSVTLDPGTAPKRWGANARRVRTTVFSALAEIATGIVV